MQSWRDQRELRELRLFLDTHGVDAASAGRIARHFGAGSIARLQREPYAICELDGIGFATADALARALDTPRDAPDRLAAGVLHALDQAQADGHCHLPRCELAARAARLLGGEVDVDDAIDALAARGRVVADAAGRIGRGAPARDRAAPRRARATAARRRAGAGAGRGRPAGERRVRPERRPVARRHAGARAPPLDPHRRARHGQERDDAHARRPAEGAQAARPALRADGQGGAAAERADRRGRHDDPPAAGVGARRGLHARRANPIAGCDVLIVDEASMLSVHLAEALLAAVGPRTHVLLVGDVDQLAPVGPGPRARGPARAGRGRGPRGPPRRIVPATRLTEVFRQAARSLIVRAAHAINAGELPDGVAGADDVRDFFLIARDGPQAIFDEVCELAATRLPAHYGLDPAADVQVLAPMHKGPLGIDALNAELRARLNPGGEAIGGTRAARRRQGHADAQLLRARPLQRRARRAAAPRRRARRVLFGGEDGRRVSLPVDALDTLRLAYAATVHKAQGSQARAIVVPVFRGHQIMLTRNLVYTAVTRAQEVCVVVGERAALALAVGRTDARRRHTRLRELVAVD